MAKKNKGRKPQRQKGYNPKGKGWYGDPTRHSLASHGIPTTEGSPQPGININVIGMDSSTSQPGRPPVTLPGVRPGVPTGLPGEPPVVSFEEDLQIEAEVKSMEDNISLLRGNLRAAELDLASLNDERKSQGNIQKAEKEEKLTHLFGKKPGWMTSVKDLPPGKQKEYQEFQTKQSKKLSEVDSKIASKKAEVKTTKARLSNQKHDLARRKDYLEDIKRMREKEQLKRVTTLEQTRTLNRLIKEGQR